MHIRELVIIRVSQHQALPGQCQRLEAAQREMRHCAAWVEEGEVWHTDDGR
jgi:hypothetical protein